MMRMPVLLVLAAVTFFAGCGGEDDTSSSTTTTTLPPLECPDPVVVSSTADLVAVLAVTEWKGLGAYTSGPLPITPDLVVTGSVTLDAADLPIPAECLGRPDCRPGGAFLMGTPPPGAALEGEAGLDCGSGASRLTLTNTTVRLRPFLRDTHPCRYNFVPLVSVAPPCGTPCGGGQNLCPVDGACYSSGTAYCQSCEGGSKESCACRGPDGPLEEGTSCSYWQSGDVLCNGSCRQGRCAAEPCP